MANPMDRPNQDLPDTSWGIQHGQTSFRQNGREQHLPSRNIEVQKITYPDCLQGLLVRLRNSFPNWAHAATKESPVQKIFEILQHEMSGDFPAVEFGRIPSLHGCQLFLRLRLDPVDRLSLQTSGLRDC